MAPQIVPSKQTCSNNDGRSTELLTLQDEEESLGEESSHSSPLLRLSASAARQRQNENLVVPGHDDTNDLFTNTTTTKCLHPLGDDDDDDDATDSDEMAFLFLPKCAVVHRGGGAPPPPRGKWMDLDISTAAPQCNNAASANDADTTECSCSKCNLVIQSYDYNNNLDARLVQVVQDNDTITADHPSQGTCRNLTKNGIPHQGLRVVASHDIARFDGTIKDTIHHANSCGQQRRSDAALGLGLAMACQDLNFVKIRKIRVCFHSPNEAAIVITFCVPHLLLDDNNCGKAKQPTKVLPQCCQLLLTLLQSDWTKLYKQMEEATTTSLQTNQDVTTTTVTPMFPSAITLEELYIRLLGASSKQEGASRVVSNKLPAAISSSPLTSLPEDVVVTMVAPFLRAKSLDSLRCSCKYLHGMLRSVVPGLRLQLYRHQIKSLEWMRTRETCQVTEQQLLQLDDSSNNNLHGAVSGGATVCLSFRPESCRHYNNNSSAKIMRIDSRFGSTSRVDTLLQSRVNRNVARGGMLCDDPGLGKTITVLSLILQTYGLSTRIIPNPPQAKHCVPTTHEIFAAYWNEEVVPYYQTATLRKLMNRLAKERDAFYFVHPVDPVRDDCPDYLNVVEQPICFNQIQQRIETGHYYGSDFDAFCKDVRLCFSNATLYNQPGHVVHEAAIRLQQVFDAMITTEKETTVQNAIKAFSNAEAKPNSSVAYLLDQRSKLQHLDAWLDSSATLLVVPSVLLTHWEEQLNMHLEPLYCTNKIPIVFHYHAKRQRRRNNRHDELSKDEVMEKVENETHFPFIFIDYGTTRRLPCPEFLAMFQIVITTNQRLSNEWKNGSYQDELREQQQQQGGGDEQQRSSSFSSRAGYVDYYYNNGAAPSANACPLLKVHWLRLIVDEGHAMGRGTHNNAIRFASWIRAQRRWAMTGTPTPQTISLNGLSNIYGLLNFLQHEFFLRKLDGDEVWKYWIKNGWNDGNLSSFFRLRNVLLLLMVRHTKRDIEELQPPQFHQTFSIMSQEEVTAYNTLVSAIQTNLVATAMEGKTSGKQDSLLHRSQLKYARKAFSNVRLACSGGTRVVPTLTKKFWDETTEMLAWLGVDPLKTRLVENFLGRAVTEQLSSCMCCGMQLSTLLLLPCGDLICTECMDSQTRSCPVCDTAFDVDDFQKLQPGFVYDWKWNLEDAKHKQTTSQPQLEDGESSNDAAGRTPRDVVDMEAEHSPIVQLEPMTRTRRKGDGHECEYSSMRTDGVCRLCLEEHDECVLPERHSKCPVCFRVPEPCPPDESKYYYLINKLEHLLKNQKCIQSQQRTCSAASRLIGETVVAHKKRPAKVIVFSQFRQILDLVGHRLLRRFGAGCIAEYWGYARRQELAKFVKSSDCFCMLLGKDGSEGLDLSFVTHIFFLDQVWDKSLENQVVARAYRMGAQGHVEVETLISKHSVEQTMSEIEETMANNKKNLVVADDVNDDGDAPEGTKTNGFVAKDYQRTKLHYLLKNLSLIKQDTFVRNQGQALRKRRQAQLLNGGTNNNELSNNDERQHKKKSAKRVRFAEDASSLR